MPSETLKNNKNRKYFNLEVAPTSYFVKNLEYNLQGKRGVWIKLPIEQVNLVEAAVKVNTFP